MRLYARCLSNVQYIPILGLVEDPEDPPRLPRGGRGYCDHLRCLILKHISRMNPLSGLSRCLSVRGPLGTLGV